MNILEMLVNLVSKSAADVAGPAPEAQKLATAADKARLLAAQNAATGTTSMQQQGNVFGQGEGSRAQQLDQLIQQTKPGYGAGTQ